MSINVTREKYFFQFINETPPAEFKHMPAASQPVFPTFPGSLTAPQIAEVRAWRSSSGAAKAALYAALSATAKTKVDLIIAYDLLNDAWMSADNLARRTQYAWLRADAAISNYAAVPPSGSNTGTGSGAPATPQTKQEP